MSESITELYSLLVPLNEGRLIVPRASVAEVVRYIQPERSPEYPSWFRGLVGWNDARLPVVWFEELCGLKSAQPGGRTRIVVFHALSDALASRHLGVIAEGFPQMVRINEQVIKLDEDYQVKDGSPVICRVRMINEYALIPDLEVLEALLQRQLGEHGQVSGQTAGQ